MLSVIDCHGNETSYGYTKDADGEIWYWNVQTSDPTVRFRDWGYHVDHPIHSGDVPDDVRDAAQTHVDALIEQNDTPWY